MKKVISAVVCLAMICCIMPVFEIPAIASRPYFYLFYSDEDYYDVGEQQLIVGVQIQNGVGLTSFSFNVSYNPDVITPNTIKMRDSEDYLSEDARKARCSLAINPDDPGKLVCAGYFYDHLSEAERDPFPLAYLTFNVLDPSQEAELRLVGEAVLQNTYRASFSISCKIPFDPNKTFRLGDDVQGVLTPDGVLTVTGTGPMKDYDKPRLQKHSNKIKTVVIEDGVTTIGNHVFSSLLQLESVAMPNSVVSVGDNAFSFCEALTDIKVSPNITAIGNDAFKNCFALKTFKMPTALTAIGNSAFEKCAVLEDIKLPDHLTSIGESAFCYCQGLKDVVIPDTVKEIGEMAFAYTGLDSIRLPEGISTISAGMFSPEGVKNVYFPKSIKKVEANAFNTVAQYFNTNVFYSGSEKDWKSVAIDASGNDALLNATMIYNYTEHEHKWDEGAVTVAPTTEEEGVKTYTCTICGAKKLEILPPDPLANQKTSGDFIYEVTDGKAVIVGCADSISGEIEIPAEIDGYPVAGIGDSAFAGRENITSVTVAEGIVTIGGGAFSKCTGLTAVSLPDSVTEIGGGVFQYCSNLIKVKLSANLTHIPSGFFFRCEKLPEIEIPSKVESIGEACFDSCKALKKLTFPEGLTSIGLSSFSECTNLKEVTLPASLNSVYALSFTEYYCPALTDIYYNGTEEQWNQIWFYGGYPVESEFKTSATIHFLGDQEGDLLVVDTATNITVTGPDNAYDGEPELKIDPITAPEVTVSLLKKTYLKTTAYDIATLLNGQSAQPSAPVTVTIPLPEGYQPESTVVFHIDKDGNAETMKISVENGFISFETTGFSTFVIVDSATEVVFELGKVDGDNEISSADARLALRASVKLEDYAPFSREFSAADVNNDGKIGSDDARMILRVSVKLESF